MKNALFAILVLLAFGSPFVFAGCSSSSYAKMCSGCSFDNVTGKVDSSCWKGLQTSGITCTSTSYPIMSAAYSAGKCPQVDACAAELTACTAQYGTGNDKADCAEGSKAVCFSAADQCIRSAAKACGEVEKECPGSSAVVGAVLGIVIVRSLLG